MDGMTPGSKHQPPRYVFKDDRIRELEAQVSMWKSITTVVTFVFLGYLMARFFV